MEYRYKPVAIRSAASCFKKIIESKHLETDITLVPIPPSKTATHVDYDDRVLQVCHQTVSTIKTPDVRDLIQCINDIEPTHNEQTKPPPDELIKNYKLVYEAGYQPRKYLFLVDDMLTTGSHFVACKDLIQSTFPNTEVTGIFISKRVFPPFEFPAI